MTELQIGLIALGAAAVVGVFGYNKWQENRHRKVAESVLQPDHDDVLLGDAQQMSSGWRSEPVSMERLEPAFTKGMAEPFCVEPPREEARFTPASPKPAPAQLHESSLADFDDNEDLPEVPLELLDPRTEFIVAMELVEPVFAQQIFQSQREALQQVSKPIHWLAYNPRDREWERLLPDSEVPVRRLRVGLQLVNRLGPISDPELAIFTGAMQVLADELMVLAIMPTTQVRDQASELDAFCAAVDLEIGVNLISQGSAFSGTKIRALAESAGMVLGVDGLFTRYDDTGRAQFSLQNFETGQFSADTIRSMTTHGLTFLLDVPRVDHGERVFTQMTELARRFAEVLHGVLVDDNRAPLGEPQLDHIRREFVAKPQASMATFGLPAGSPQTLRLFS